jgi:hypothetical protein
MGDESNFGMGPVTVSPLPILGRAKLLIIAMSNGKSALTAIYQNSK